MIFLRFRRRDFRWPYPSLLDKDPKEWMDHSEAVHWQSPDDGRGFRQGLLDALADIEPSTEDLDRLFAAIRFLDSMLVHGRAELARLVAEAYHRGATWEQIAETFEVTRQAAHKRFSDEVSRVLGQASLDARWGGHRPYVALRDRPHK